MMMARKKNLVDQILGPEQKDEGGGDSALKSCVEELIGCIKADDADGAVNALRACYAELTSEQSEEVVE